MVDIAPLVGAGAEEEIERFLAIGQMDEFVREVVFLQRADGEFRVLRVVFDEEDFQWIVHGFGFGMVKEKVAPRSTSASAQTRPP